MAVSGLVELPPDLSVACNAGDITRANTLADAYLTNHPDITSQKLLTAMAVRAGYARHPELMRACHDRGLRIGDTDSAGSAALAYAAIAAEEEPTLLRRYLDEGNIPIDYVCDMDLDLFNMAVWQNRPAAGAFLLDRGADVNSRYSLESYALAMVATQPDEDADDVRFLRLMLERGAHIRDTGALREASQVGRLLAVQLLVEYGADLEELPAPFSLHNDEDSATAVWLAAANGHTQVVRYLLDKGANPRSRDAKEGLTVVEIARGRGFPETADAVQQALN